MNDLRLCDVCAIVMCSVEDASVTAVCNACLDRLEQTADERLAVYSCLNCGQTTYSGVCLECVIAQDNQLHAKASEGTPLTADECDAAYGM